MYAIKHLLVGMLLLIAVGDSSTRATIPRCELVPLHVHFNEAKVVFSGEVTNLRRSGEFTDVTFRPLTSWKNARRNQIVVSDKHERILSLGEALWKIN